MKTKNKTLAVVEIAILLCSVFLMALPAIAAEQNQTTQKVSASTITAASEIYEPGPLDIFGNANEDDTIDMRDTTYIKLAIFGKKPKTDLADANNDGKISMLDVGQTKLIILGKEKELTFEDIFGEAVTVHKPVKRMVVTKTDCTEVVRVLKAEDNIVGVCSWVKKKTIYMPELSKLPSVGNPSHPDYEAILELNPDVFLSRGLKWREESLYKEKLPGVTVVIIDLESALTRRLIDNKWVITSETYPGEVMKLGYILDKEEEAEEFCEWWEGWFNKIKSRTEGLSDDKKQRVFMMGSFKDKGYRTYGATGRGQAICNIAGGKNIAEDLIGGGSVTVDPEWLMEQNPDVISSQAGRPYGYETDDLSGMIATREKIMNQPELARVNAVKDRRVYMVSHGVLVMGGAHGLIGIAYHAKWFHPDLFEDIDPQEIHQEYVDKFCHIDFNVKEHGVFVYPPIV